MKWQNLDCNESCPNCGDDLDVLTDADDLSCHDGDKIRCVGCGLGGWITVFEEGDTLAHFDDES